MYVLKYTRFTFCVVLIRVKSCKSAFQALFSSHAREIYSMIRQNVHKERIHDARSNSKCMVCIENKPV